MPLSDLPKTLYKYREWDNKFHRSLISMSELFFSKWSGFNDPYDTNLPIKFELTFDAELFKHQFLKDSGKFPTPALIQEAEKLWKSGQFDDIVESEKSGAFQKVLEIEQACGIYCLSAINSHFLMWGHYANCHKGFCVGLNTEVLLNYLQGLFGNDCLIRRIKYSEYIPILNSNIMSDIEKYAIDRFLIKFKDWNYEEEIRVVVKNMAFRTIQLPLDAFEEVIFGYQMDEQSKAELTYICKHRMNNLKFFKAVPSQDEFKMKIIPI